MAENNNDQVGRLRRRRIPECADWSRSSEETGTVRSRLMGTDGSRFTNTYALEDNVFHYWFGEKGSPIFSRGVISRDGRSIDGRWTIPGVPGGGYDYHLTRMD